MVVDRRQHGRHVVDVVGRDERNERRDVDGRAYVVVRVGVHDRAADRGVAEAEARVLHLEARRAVGGGAQPGLVVRLRAVDARRHHVGGMQARAVRGIDLPFGDLRPVRLHLDLEDAHPHVRRRREGRRLELGHFLGRPHIGPHEAAGLARRIGLVLELACEAAFRWLRGHLQHIAFDVELPAVIEAAQPAFLIAAEHQRGAPVRTVFVEHAEAAVAVAKDHEVLAEQPNPDRGSIRFRHLLGHAGGDPMPPHELAHGRVALDPAQEIVFLGGHHGQPPAERVMGKA